MKLQGLKDWGYSTSSFSASTTRAGQESPTASPTRGGSLGGNLSITRLSVLQAKPRSITGRRAINSQALVSGQYGAQSTVSVFDALIALSIFGSITAVSLLAFAKLG
jgi:hypothetical protein